MENLSWLVTSARSLFVDLAMSTRDEKAIKLVLNAKPVTNGLKVSVFDSFRHCETLLETCPQCCCFDRKSEGCK